jgi:hypothetical protein
MTGYILSVMGFVWYTNLTHGGKPEKQTMKKRSYTQLVDEEEMEVI